MDGDNHRAQFYFQRDVRRNYVFSVEHGEELLSEPVSLGCGVSTESVSIKGNRNQKKKKSHAGPSLSRYLKPGRQNGCGRCLMRRHTGSEEQELMVG